MSTRSITTFYDNGGRPYLNLYNHYDGYPKGYGATLSMFLQSKHYHKNNIEKTLGLLVWYICEFIDKDGIYLYPPDKAPDCQYHYKIYPQTDRIKILKHDVVHKAVFDGLIKDFVNSDIIKA